MSTSTDNFNQRWGFEEAMTAAIVQSSPYCANYLFYASMIVQCATVFKPMEAPASVHFNVDHYVLSIDPEKFNAFPLEHRLGVLKHEMLHILGGHLIRFEDRENFQKWNFATDCAINQLIDASHLPSGCIYPNNLPVKPNTKVPVKVNSEQYYDIIDDQKLPPEDGSGDGDGNGPSTLDDHSEWKNSKGTNETLQKDIAKNMMEKATNETQKSRGNIPSEFSNWLELNSNSHQISWQRVLRNLTGNKRVNTRRTIMRSDRRFPKREDLKGKTKDRMFNLLLIGDESGSVSSEELVQGLAEVQNICKMTKTSLDYIAIDTQAHAPVKLTSSQRTFKRVASGGTNLHPALDMAKKHNIDFQAIVVITDGGLCSSDVAHFEAVGKRVIWLITSQGCIMDEMKHGNMQAYKLDNK